jgi:hypothetical protein
VQRGLIIVHREESAEDFKEIALKIKQLDPSIKGAIVSDWIFEERFPKEFFEMPLLVIYLVNPPNKFPEQFVFPNATNIAVSGMTKIEEYEHFKKHNLPCLPIERFRWGMELDPAIYGDWIVLKPEFMTSNGKDVNMVPTNMISKLKVQDFHINHLIHQDSYLVQKFIKTGENSSFYRVLIFLDEILLSYRPELNTPYPDTLDLKKLLDTSISPVGRSDRKIHLEINEEVNALAKLAASSFPDNPLWGVDIIRDQQTGKLYVLEVNLGGNTWGFSNAPGQKLRSMVGIKNMVLQYNAWDRAAEALVRKTHELAS